MGRQGTGIIVLSFLVGFFLTATPLPDWVDHFRPNWLMLILIFWCMVLPERVGIAIGWLIGLCMDVAKGTLLGQHALAFALIAFIVVRGHQRLRMFPLWQQSICVLLLLAMGQLLVFWIDALLGYPPRDFRYLAPALGGMILWPAVALVLQDIGRRFRVEGV